MNHPWSRPESYTGGGRSPSGRSAVTILIAINVAVFIVQAFTGDLSNPGYGGFMTRYFGLSREGIASGYIWQMVTYMFLHGGVFHLLANMLVIYFAGCQVERIMGRKPFLTLYFAGGVIGGLSQILTTSSPLVGASAAGFATLIAFTTILPEIEITLLLFFILPVRMKAKYLAYGAFGISLLFVVFPPGDNIGHLAHLAGCITGWVFARRMGYGAPLAFERALEERRQRKARMENLPPERYLSEEIDPILDKISRHGMHSLTREERRILERGREKIARKSSVR